MTERKIRQKQQVAAVPTAAETVPFEQAVTRVRSNRLSIDSAVAAKVDAYAQKSEYLKAQTALYKNTVVSTELELAQLQKELMDIAKERDVMVLEGRAAIIQVTSSTSSSIEPKKLLSWLKRVGQIGRFWECVKVGIGDAKKSFGEKVLKNEGILTEHIEKFGRLKIVKKG